MCVMPAGRARWLLFYDRCCLSAADLSYFRQFIPPRDDSLVSPPGCGLPFFTGSNFIELPAGSGRTERNDWMGSELSER